MNCSIPQNRTGRFDGWFACLVSILFAIFATTLSIWQISAGTWSVFVSNARILEGAFTATQLAFAAVIWTALVFAIFPEFTRSRSLIFIFATSPFVALTIINAIRCIQAPPSPDGYFRQNFGQALPPNASNISIRPDSMPDRGHVGYYFETTPDQTQTLIENLQLLTIPSDAFEGFPLFRIPNISEPTPISEHAWFEHTKSNGCGIILATDRSRTHVFLTREPLWDKADDESIQSNPPTQ